MTTDPTNVWLPDGRGLPDTVNEILNTFSGQRVHLRLTSQVEPNRYPRTACHTLAGIGEWWTGKAAEVTCLACLELVHA